MRAMVGSTSMPWNMSFWKCFLKPSSWNHSSWLSWKYSEAVTRNPEVPAAGSQITSSFLGCTMSTIMRMMCRGVRNCPLVPAEAILDSMYSYRSPLVSRSSMSTPSMSCTTWSNSRGVEMMKVALLMNPCKHTVLVADLFHVVKHGHAFHRGTRETTKHRLGIFVLELIPTKRLLPLREQHLLHGDAHQSGLLFLLQLLLVQAANEQQVRELLNDGNGIGNSTCPKSFPDFVNLTFEFACDHSVVVRIDSKVGFLCPRLTANRLNSTQLPPSIFATT